MTDEQDFDDAIYGGLLADDDISPEVAMAAAMPDEQPRTSSNLPAVVGAIAALAAVLIWMLLG